MNASIIGINLVKGFGFVRCEDGDEAFLHAASLTATPLADLRVGDTLEVEVKDTPKGPRVTKARRLTDPPFPPKPVPGVRLVGVLHRVQTHRGFGFIRTDANGDVFFHASDLSEGEFEGLVGGERVAFVVTEDENARLRARAVEVLD